LDMLVSLAIRALRDCGRVGALAFVDFPDKR
jgi:hypothetical protein